MKHGSIRLIQAGIIVSAFLCALQVQAATLTFGGGGSVPTESAISVRVQLSTAGGESANAVSAKVVYPSSQLQLVSISKGGSIISLWAQEPSYSQAGGTAEFEGVILNPGFTGSGGTIVTLNFVTKKAGTASLTFSDAHILANDGKGTEILTASPGTTIVVTEAEQPPATPAAQPRKLLITSVTNPNENAVYEPGVAVFDWTNSPSATAVRIGYDSSPNGTPTVVYSPPISHKEIELPEGVWYFHAQERVGNTWGPIATYKVNMSSKAPESRGSPTAPTLEATTTPITSISNDLLSPFALGLIALGLVAAGLFFMVGKVRKRGGLVSLTHTHRVVHKQFEELRDAVMDEISSLEKVRSKRDLTAEEERIIARMTKLITKAEHAVEEEVDTILNKK